MANLDVIILVTPGNLCTKINNMPYISVLFFNFWIFDVFYKKKVFSARGIFFLSWKSILHSHFLWVKVDFTAWRDGIPLHAIITIWFM